MASFLVETYLPTTTSLDDVERRVSRAAADLSTARSRVRLVRSIYVAEDETCFLLFEARSAGAVRRTSERAELGALRVVEAIDAQRRSG